ncbi:hypothetical protein OGAPHI_003366 [Ogataea philodendri]|uniref:Uncharacterized protein n=1 Tax=Ogataea philodendri TaxID=1378263 RepID=A0A9P8T5L6_9ASCO|nr:uncharacterized protein OGAPHI_003366 [Ogataea philodendri]KAH3666916.1 hypothetical protein OGAPHI_003366 [Ogataea philodendri]
MSTVSVALMRFPSTPSMAAMVTSPMMLLATLETVVPRLTSVQSLKTLVPELPVKVWMFLTVKTGIRSRTLTASCKTWTTPVDPNLNRTRSLMVSILCSSFSSSGLRSLPGPTSSKVSMNSVPSSYLM